MGAAQRRYEDVTRRAISKFTRQFLIAKSGGEHLGNEKRTGRLRQVAPFAIVFELFIVDDSRKLRQDDI